MWLHQREQYGIITYVPKRRPGDTFHVVIQKDWQRQVMLECINENQLILMDTTHGTTTYRDMFLTTLMVIRPNERTRSVGFSDLTGRQKPHSGISVAWMLHEQQDATIYWKFLDSIFTDEETRQKVSHVMLDEDHAESRAVMTFFGTQVRIYWCRFHVISAIKNYMNRKIHMDSDEHKLCSSKVRDLIYAPSEDLLEQR